MQITIQAGAGELEKNLPGLVKSIVHLSGRESPDDLLALLKELLPDGMLLKAEVDHPIRQHRIPALQTAQEHLQHYYERVLLPAMTERIVNVLSQDHSGSRRA